MNNNVDSTCVNAVRRQAQPTRRRSDRSGALAEEKQTEYKRPRYNSKSE